MWTLQPFDAGTCAALAQILPVFMLVSVLDARFMIRFRSLGRGGMLNAWAFYVAAALGELFALVGVVNGKGLNGSFSAVVALGTFVAFMSALGGVQGTVLAMQKEASDREDDRGSGEV